MLVLGAHSGNRSFSKLATITFALVTRQHFCVDKCHRVIGRKILGVTNQLSVDHQLVALRVNVVCNRAGSHLNWCA